MPALPTSTLPRRNRSTRLKGIARKRAPIVGIAIVLAGAAFLVNRFLLGGDDPAEVPTVRARVLAPGSFTAAHPYAPYYSVPDKRLSGPDRLSELATAKFVTAPESALEKGAMPASPQVVRFELRVQGDEPVTIESVRARIVSDARPLKGWFIAAPGCAVERRVRVAHLNLDMASKRSRKIGIEVGPHDRRSIEIQASTRRSRIAWVAELTVSGADDSSATIAVDDSGEPFRVTSPTASRGFAPLYGATGIAGFERRRGWDDGVETGC